MGELAAHFGNPRPRLRSPSHVAASLLWLLRPTQPHSRPRRRVRAGAAPSRPLGPPQNRGPRAPGTRPGCRRRSARGRDHHWLRPGPGRWGALTLPALGTWASPAFPTPRGCSRHVAWRQPCGVQTTRMVSVTQLSHGLCTNLRGGRRVWRSTPFAAAPDKPRSLNLPPPHPEWAAPTLGLSLPSEQRPGSDEMREAPKELRKQ